MRNRKQSLIFALTMPLIVGSMVSGFAALDIAAKNVSVMEEYAPPRRSACHFFPIPAKEEWVNGQMVYMGPGIGMECNFAMQPLMWSAAEHRQHWMSSVEKAQ